MDFRFQWDDQEGRTCSAVQRYRWRSGWTCVHCYHTSPRSCQDKIPRFHFDLLFAEKLVNDGRKSFIPAYSSTWGALKTISMQEGYKSLYSGLSANVLGATLAWGLYFYAYVAGFLPDVAGTVLLSKYSSQFYATQRHPDLCSILFARLQQVVLRACPVLTIGVCTAVVTNPVWLVKTRMQLQMMGKTPAEFYYSGVWGLNHICRHSHSRRVPSHLSTRRGQRIFSWAGSLPSTRLSWVDSVYGLRRQGRDRLC